MAVAAGIRAAGGGGGGVGTVTSVNGVAPVLGDVSLAATDIPYTPTFATAASVGNPSTSVGDQLLWSETNIGPGSWVWDESTLEKGFPVSTGTHTIDRPSLWLAPLGGAPINLTAGNDVLASHPGSIYAFGAVKVVLIGSVDGGPLVRGEVLAEGLGILNTSVVPGAEDLQIESPSGRPVGTENVTLLGFGGATFENIYGPAAFRSLILFPPAPGARGVVMDGIIGSLVLTECIAVAPGGMPYPAFTLAPTATVAVSLRGEAVFNTVLAGDILFDLSASATVPTTPLPTGDVGLRFVGCEVNGPGSLYNPLELNAGSIEVSSFGHLNGQRSNFIADWRIDTTGAPPPILMDHTGVGGTPLLIPLDNSQNGGAGGTLRTLTATASVSRHTLISGTVELATVNLGGSYTGADADYPATQASTSGAGIEAEFTVTLVGGAITAVVSVDDDGSGYVVGDTITLTVIGPTETVAAVLNAAETGWYVRSDGAEGPLTGPIRWRASVARSGSFGSSALVYLERKLGGAGAWVEVPGTRSSPIELPTSANPADIFGGALLDDLVPGDRWRPVLINDVSSSALTEVHVFEILAEGQP